MAQVNERVNFLAPFLARGPAFRNASSSKVERRFSTRCSRDNSELAGKRSGRSIETRRKFLIERKGGENGERGSSVKERASIKVWPRGEGKGERCKRALYFRSD